MDRVLLFSMNTDRIKVTIEAYFDEKGNLVIDGYDIGKAAEEFWGDIDYEYSITVPAEELPKLCEIFNLPTGSREALLNLLQSKYNTNKCYSELRDMLDENHIKCEGFSWM